MAFRWNPQAVGSSPTLRQSNYWYHIMRLKHHFILLALVSFSLSAASGPVVSKTGQFEYTFSRIDISPTNIGRGQNSYQATVGFEVKNTGATPIMVAFVPQWPTVHADNGTIFKMRAWGIKGIHHDARSRVGNCLQHSENFTIIRPGYSAIANIEMDSETHSRELGRDVRKSRFSGELLVYSSDIKKCWKENISATDIETKVAE